LAVAPPASAVVVVSAAATTVSAAAVVVVVVAATGSFCKFSMSFKSRLAKNGHTNGAARAEPATARKTATKEKRILSGFIW